MDEDSGIETVRGLVTARSRLFPYKAAQGVDSPLPNSLLGRTSGPTPYGGSSRSVVSSIPASTYLGNSGSDDGQGESPTTSQERLNPANLAHQPEILTPQCPAGLANFSHSVYQDHGRSALDELLNLYLHAGQSVMNKLPGYGLVGCACEGDSPHQWCLKPSCLDLERTTEKMAGPPAAGKRQWNRQRTMDGRVRLLLSSDLDTVPHWKGEENLL